MTKFCTVAHNIFGSCIWWLLHVTLFVPRILRWYLFFVKSVHPALKYFTFFHLSTGFIQVRIQTQPGFVSTLRAAAPLIYKDEGMNGFYKGLVPLWMRQIPYTMMKFACFEKTIELLYRYADYIYTYNLFILDLKHSLSFAISIPYFSEYKTVCYSPPPVASSEIQCVALCICAQN